jgi:hypothetical protein
MKDIDRNVETVLRGLRDVQPEASLEQRIARALQAEPAVSERTPWFRGWAFAMPIAAVLGIAIAANLLHLQHTSRDQEAARLATRMPSVPTQPLEPTVPGDLQWTPTSVTAHAVPHRMVRAHVPGAPPQEPRSFPAPELPLTEQERLLLRLTHRDDPVQLARLAPGPRADRYQAEKDAVSEFFKPAEQQPESTEVESGGTQ